MADARPCSAPASIDGWIDRAGAIVAADEHAGRLLASDRSLPRRSDAIGRFVEALDAFRRCHQGDDACRNRVQWLGGVRERP